MKRSDNIAWSQVKIGIFIVCALIFLAGGILIMGKQTKLFLDKGQISVIMTDVAIDDVAKQGAVVPGSRADLARTGMGVGVREGAPKPDIATSEAFM